VLLFGVNRNHFPLSEWQEEVLLSASHDKTVRIWDLRARGKGPIQVLTGAVDSVLCLMTHGDAPLMRFGQWATVAWAKI
jgi:WD40 repeat protein